MSTIPKDSLILITGANGFIGSHIANTLLSQGYRVRGTARSAAKLAPLHALFDQKYGAGRFEVAVVPDMAVEGAFGAAMHGVAGVAHVASIKPEQADPASLENPELVIGPVVAGTLSVLRSAAATPTVKSVVLTSSSTSGVWSRRDVEFYVGEDTWNKECLEKAANLPADAPGKEWHIYGASKVRGEQAAWKFYNEEKPGYVFNTILPNINLGPSLLRGDARSTGAAVSQAYNSDTSAIAAVAPQWFVDVRDTALLHCHALIGTTPALRAGGVRMWAVAATFSANDILASLRRLFPAKVFPEDLPDMGKVLYRIDNKRAGELLAARGGWRSLDESVKATIDAELA